MDNVCKCGKVHRSSVEHSVIENGAVNLLPKLVAKYGATKVFVLADINTYNACAKTVCSIFENNNISYTKFVFSNTALEPDEHAVGSAVMNYDKDCDLIVAVGSGVINDIGKILSNITNNPYFIVATAPSMDGYASATSSMSVNGLKISLNSKCPNVIIGDIDILKNAPVRMLQAGLGDMLAKYISICEWRIANLLIGEYYCDYVANIVRDALAKCIDNAEGLLKREDNAVKATFEGLVIGGMAMEYAGLSRPASGVEHYISHVWDMRGLSFGTKVDLHGIQCAIGTLYSAKIYDYLRNFRPDKEKALKYVAEFDIEKWNANLKDFIGNGADAMIELERKEQKYNIALHAKRLDKIIDNWDKILQIIDEEIPTYREISKILDTISAPHTCDEIGIDPKTMPLTFKATKDIRDKYVLSRLCWDLGILDEVTAL